MRGASLITEGPWPGEGRVLPPSRKRVRTRSQPVRSWRSMARRPELARAHLVAAAAVVSRPAPCHHHPPPRLAFSGGGSGAAGCRPTRVTGVGGGVGVHLPQASWYCSPTLPAPPIWPPRLTVVRPNAAHGRSRKGSERKPGDERGAARAGRAHHSSRPTLTPPTPRGEDPR